MTLSFPIMGTFFTPMHSTLTVSAPGVYYLGRVSAAVRERKDDEFRAGPPIPLIDQAVAGASGGTFEIEIVDAWNEDENRFRQRFPVIATHPVQKAILPAFDRPTAQKWWQDH
ncbi:MAG: hypothetical protein EOP39_30515 [Rubrivivax sp.]|nr:MAG: hypothetical protein EOP39_30515 [Rubrivivax sp.]